MIKTLHKIFPILFIWNSFVSQNNDSLYKVFKDPARSDSQRIDAIYEYASALQYNYPDSSFKLAGECLSFSKTKKLNHGIGYSLMQQGNVHCLKGEYDQALYKLNKALEYLLPGHNLYAISSAYSSIGSTYYLLSDYTKSLDYHFKAFKIRDSLEDGDKGGSLLNIGAVYSQLQNYKKANEYQLQALKYYDEMQMDEGKAMALGNLSSNCFSVKDYKGAMLYQLQSLKLEQKNKNQTGIAQSLDVIGSIFTEEGNFSQAEYNLNQSLEIKTKLNDLAGQGITFSNLAYLYLKKKDLPKALEFAQKARLLSKQVGDLYTTNAIQLNLVNIYKGQKNYQAALEEMEIYLKLKDSLFADEHKREAALKGMQYDFDKKESDLKIEQGVKNALDAEEKRKQRMVIYGVSAILLLTLVLAAVIFKSLQANKRKNKIITEQKQEVEKQKELVEHQKEIVLEKQKEILDSINYARRIQRAHLPTEKYVAKSLNRLTGKKE